jgi:hypothetical protein
MRLRTQRYGELLSSLNNGLISKLFLPAIPAILEHQNRHCGLFILILAKTQWLWNCYVFFLRCMVILTLWFKQWRNIFRLDLENKYKGKPLVEIGYNTGYKKGGWRHKIFWPTVDLTRQMEGGVCIMYGFNSEKVLTRQSRYTDLAAQYNFCYQRKDLPQRLSGSPTDTLVTTHGWCCAGIAEFR